MSLTRKLLEVAKTIKPVNRSGGGSFFAQGYVSETDLLERVRPALLERGLLLLPKVKNVQKDGELTTVLMEITILDVDSGEQLTFEWAGQDKGDKGLYKAYTGALKHFLMKTFMIPSKNEDEDHASEEQVIEYNKFEEPATDSQKAWLRKRIKEVAAKMGKPIVEVERTFVPKGIDNLTKKEASQLIDRVSSALVK